jgi:hypothetical protein
MIEWYFATLRQYPEIAIFLALGLGFYFGSFTFKGIGLGSVTATLLAAVIIGQIGITISAPCRVRERRSRRPLQVGSRAGAVFRRPGLTDAPRFLWDTARGRTVI